MRRHLFDRAAVALKGSCWGFIAIRTMSFYLKNHQAGNDTTLVTRGVAKCIRESKTEKDVIDMLERGQLERTSEILLKNNEIKSRGEVSCFFYVFVYLRIRGWNCCCSCCCCSCCINSLTLVTNMGLQ